MPDGGTNGAPTALGIAFRAGVVLAATGGRVRGSTVTGSDRSVEAIHPTAAVTLTGELGDVQEFVRRLRAEVDRREAEQDEPMELDALATFAGGLLRDDARSEARFLLGGTDDDGSHLYVLDSDGGITEDDYAAVGSGAQVAYGVFESVSPDELDREEATTVATDALGSAVARDPSSVGTGYLAEISAEGVDVRELDSLGE